MSKEREREERIVRHRAAYTLANCPLASNGVFAFVQIAMHVAGELESEPRRFSYLQPAVLQKTTR